MHARFPALLMFATCLMLQACATRHSAAPGTSAAVIDFGSAQNFGERPAILSPAALHRLTPSQQQEFLAWYKDPRNARLKGHERLARYLRNITTGFNYQGDTFSAAEAYASNSGNCLSLAILTTALAQLVNIEIRYQLVDDEPVFEFNGDVVSKGLHVRSMVYDPERRPDDAAVVFRDGLRIDYFPSGNERFVSNLDEMEYLAMYYSNVAAEAIAHGNYQHAWWHLTEALKFVPDYSVALNMLAVINRRVGDIAKAEEIYKYGIARAENKLTLLKNYHVLLLASGREADAANVERQLHAMDDPSPFHWFQLARTSYEEGNFEDAIRYYGRAVELAPYLHEAHLGLAKAYYESGRLSSAERALETALENVFRPSTRNLYEAKLLTLRREI